MLQVALGGYHNILTGQIVYDDSPVYYEPGYDIMTPLEMIVPACDRVYLLVRNRTDTSGNTFNNLTTTNLSITAKDATTNESLDTYINSNISGNTYYRIEWNQSTSYPSFNPTLFIINSNIDINIPILRVRVIDCFISHISTKDFLNFRLLIEDDNIKTNYSVIDTQRVSERFKFTSTSDTGIATVNRNGDTYVLLSPFGYLKEEDQTKADFSYPIDSIFYHRQKSFNEENYHYSISTYSHSFLRGLIEVMNVPGYQKAAVVLIDNYFNAAKIARPETMYIDIKIDGVLSGISDIFRIYLV